MTHKSLDKAAPDLQALMKEHFSNGGEVRNPAEGRKLTKPATPNSGYSIGWIQRDLSEVNRTELDRVMDFLKTDDILAEAAGALKEALGKKSSELTDADVRTIDAHGPRINDHLNTTVGREMLNDISSAETKNWNKR